MPPTPPKKKATTKSQQKRGFDINWLSLKTASQLNKHFNNIYIYFLSSLYSFWFVRHFHSKFLYKCWLTPILIRDICTYWRPWVCNCYRMRGRNPAGECTNTNSSLWYVKDFERYLMSVYGNPLHSLLLEIIIC